MSFILALFQKVSDLFASPHLPMDSDYSYEARHREAERLRRSQSRCSAFLATDRIDSPFCAGALAFAQPSLSNCVFGSP